MVDMLSWLLGRAAGGASAANPNSLEVIEGTLAAPWGEHSFGELLALLQEGSATAILQATAEDISGVVALLPRGSALVASLAEYSTGEEGPELSNGGEFRWDSEGLGRALITLGGVTRDLSPVAGEIVTVLGLLRHPMPEEDGHGE